MSSDFSLVSRPAVERDLSRASLYAFVRLAWAHAGESSAFVPNWHLEVLCSALEEISLGKRRRTVINVPPSTGKSSITGVFWPAWTWIHRPDYRWMFVSYDDGLLNRDTKKMIALMSSRWFVERFGGAIRDPNGPVSHVLFGGGGSRFNTSIRGKATGWHAHGQVIDDPIKPGDAATVTGQQLDAVREALDVTFASRAVDPSTFARTLIMQRVHEADPSAYAIERGWDSIRLPMRFEIEDPDPLDRRKEEGDLLFPARYPEHVCEALERENPEVWATQYQQRPAKKGGAIFLEPWFHTCRRDEVPAVGVRVQSWDLAFKGKESSDWIAAGHWQASGDRMFHLGEPVFRRASFVESCAELESKIHTWEASTILVEDKANGPALEDVLRKRWPGLIQLVNPEGSKVARAQSVAHLWATKRVILVEGDYVARWKRTFPRFPAVKRDDEIDQMSQALRHLGKSAGYLEALQGLR